MTEDPLARNPRAPDSPTPAKSLVDRLAEGASPWRPIRLQDASPGEGAVPAGSEARGRYQVAGEIARGGVGVVLRGRDQDLGREVALKVLRDEYAGQPDVLRRFVEEAQIGGQLQHPGIVPVYELGTGEDQRPFFAMKLVKGRTFEEILAARADPGAERQRHLASFEAICQTMAYAHARGVIHRDLKPANVMIGAFGEVLVVDWGIGKVLRDADGRRRPESSPPASTTVIATSRSTDPDSASLAGTLMGTPAYMPPEQALGEIDRVDEQSDVFGLGAILCQILTGAPPYRGEGMSVLWAAQQAAQGDAHARLKACGADARLVALAEACLAPKKEERPAGAAAVAASVAAYLADLETTARRAEREAIEARARADAEALRAKAERRARRLTLAAALSVAALVIVGGAGWAWVEDARRDRARGVAEDVALELDAATGARLRAAASPTPEALGLLQEAFAAARRARGAATSPDGSAELRERAEETLRALEADRALATAREAERQRDQEMVAQLEAIRVARAEDWNPFRVTREYAERFAGFLGGDIARLDTVQTTRRLGASPIRAQLVAALDDWLAVRDLAEEEPGPVQELAESLAPDAWRGRISRAKGDLETLRALADEALQADLTPTLAGRLCQHLAAAGDPNRAADVALANWEAHPSDFWACLHGGLRAKDADPPRSLAALRCYAAAVALRPKSAPTHNNLGVLLHDMKDREGARQAYLTAIRLAPNLAKAHVNLGNVARDEGNPKDAEAWYRKAIELAALPGAYRGLGTVLRQQGDLQGALDAHRKAVEAAPEDGLARSELSSTLLSLLRVPEALQEAERAAELSPKNAIVHVNVSKALLASGDVAGALSAAERALALDLDEPSAHTQVGLALAEKGDLAGAVARHERALSLAPDNAEYLSNLASALRRLGRHDEAMEALRKALETRPDYAGAHMNLGNLLAQQQKYDEAVEALERAAALDPRSHLAHMNLGIAQLGAGRTAQGLESLRKAVVLGPREALAHQNLAFVLWEQGQVEEALPVLRDLRRLEPGNVWAEQTLAQALRLAMVAPHVASALDGTRPPSDATEAVAMAELLQRRSSFVAAARLYEDAMARWPEVLPGGSASTAVEAARAAARAGAGLGADAAGLSPEERTAWIRKASGWLRAEWTARKAWIPRNPDRAPAVRAEVRAWATDAAFGPLRDDAATTALGAQERDALRAFWEEVVRAE